MRDNSLIISMHRNKEKIKLQRSEHERIMIQIWRSLMIH